MFNFKSDSEISQILFVSINIFIQQVIITIFYVLYIAREIQ